MSHKLALLGRIGQLCALAYLVGGIVVLGAMVAPAIFHQFHLPVVAAALIMGTLFRQFDTGILVALGALIMGELLQILHKSYSQSWVNGLRLALVLGLVGTLGYAALVTDPTIWAYQRHGVHRLVGMAGHDLDRVHKLSETLYKTGMGFGIGMLVVLAV